jgi:hypothetical protein
LLPVQAVLLFVNGLAILNNERFLEPCESLSTTIIKTAACLCTKLHCSIWSLFCSKECLHESLISADGWGFNNMTGGGHSLDSGRPGALKQQTIGLLHAIAYLRGEHSQMHVLDMIHACSRW